MFGNSGATELAYANTAILIALIRELVRSEVIPKEAAEKVLDDGVVLLSPHEHVRSIASAIGILKGPMRDQMIAG